jgi:homoserine O-acetyltransferase
MENTLKRYTIDNFVLQSGIKISQVQLAYRTYGDLNENKDNVVIMPTYYTGGDQCNEPYFGSGRAIDPAKHFIVVPSLFGNGVSSSPSNTGGEFNGPDFPGFTMYDNVTAQFELLQQQFGIEEIALVSGWSMGGCQTYHWATLYPDRVHRILPFCGSAKTSVHNFVFLEGVKAALQADGQWQDGRYTSPPRKGLRAFGRVYAGWAYSQSFYRERRYRDYGFNDVEELLQDWEEDHLEWDANDLLAMLWTWQHSDISNIITYNGNMEAALASIQAKTILMPCSTDLYFTPQDNFNEARQIANAEVRVFNSIDGHCAVSPRRPSEGFMDFFDQAVHDLFY